MNHYLSEAPLGTAAHFFGEDGPPAPVWDPEPSTCTRMPTRAFDAVRTLPATAAPAAFAACAAALAAAAHAFSAALAGRALAAAMSSIKSPILSSTFAPPPRGA